MFVNLGISINYTTEKLYYGKLIQEKFRKNNPQVVLCSEISEQCSFCGLITVNSYFFSSLGPIDMD